MVLADLELPLTNIVILEILGLLVTFVHSLGVLSAIHAVMTVRTAQGTTAWAISLVTFPWIAIPLYWVFGRSKFAGYINARRAGDSKINHLVTDLAGMVPEFRSHLNEYAATASTFERLARMPFTKRNNGKLLINGEATFGSIFEAIEKANDYILLEFFIVKNDALGQQMKSLLIKKAEAGVRIYFVYDEVGSHKLSKDYIHELQAAGVEFHPFTSNKGWRNRLQLNFRNHRKIVVVDGHVGFVGGLNIGDEYMGLDPKFGDWRDTHAKIVGPAVQCIQLAFLEDWYWATETLPELNWSMKFADQGDIDVLILPTGPADKLETCGLFFVQAIHAAEERIWICSPYFVPDSQVITALQLAALRGVDVRVILPDKADHLLVYLCSFVALEQMHPSDVKIYRYQDGFMHQKVMLIDDEFAAVGTANLDNRSFRLNFEITAIFADEEFTMSMEKMLLNDFDRCIRVETDELSERPFWFRLGVRLAQLTAPIQ